MKRLSLALLVLALPVALAGCGIKGSLERPDPLWGEPDGRDAGEPDPLPEEERRDPNEPTLPGPGPTPG
jgi:predicted small lipoprotein YifL